MPSSGAFPILDMCTLPLYKAPMTKQRILILVLAVIAGLGVAALLYMVEKNMAVQQKGGLHAVTDDVFGGPINLTDQNGKKVTDADFAGKYKLMFFGFTYCPAICPTELSKITTVMKTLEKNGGDAGKNIQPIYITVDPERDTAAKMKNYVSLFHPSLVGLTGSPQEIKDTLKAYKVYAAKVEQEGLTEYTMDHSTFTYFIAPDGRLLHIFKMSDTASYMAETISAWMSQESASKTAN